MKDQMKLTSEEDRVIFHFSRFVYTRNNRSLHLNYKWTLIIIKKVDKLEIDQGLFSFSVQLQMHKRKMFKKKDSHLFDVIGCVS